MKLIETKISETAIRMRYADQEDPAEAKEWIYFQVPLAALTNPSDERQRLVGDKLEDRELQFLAELHRAALRYVRDAIGEETKRLASLASRNF